MNPKIIIILALRILLLVPMAACQEEGLAKNGGATAPPARKLAGDVDLGHGYVRRDGTIHFIGGGTTGTGANATRIDTPLPLLLRKVVAHKYGPFNTAEGMDVASFQPLSEEYTRDKDRVYYKVISPGVFLVIMLPDADPASFAVLGDSFVAKDRGSVYRSGQLLRGLDPASVELILHDPMGYDHSLFSTVFCFGIQTHQADGAKQACWG